MDKILEISLLLDFYGNLLTEKQRNVLELHYNNDYSYAEIAEHMQISRQGVFDNLKRGMSSLFKFEEKLGLIAKFIRQKEKMRDIEKANNNISVLLISCEQNGNYSELFSGIKKEMKKIKECLTFIYAE